MRSFFRNNRKPHFSLKGTAFLHHVKILIHFSDHMLLLDRILFIGTPSCLGIMDHTDDSNKSMNTSVQLLTNEQWGRFSDIWFSYFLLHELALSSQIEDTNHSTPWHSVPLSTVSRPREQQKRNCRHCRLLRYIANTYGERRWAGKTRIPGSRLRRVK